MSEPTIAERVSSAFETINMAEAISVAFGKCPRCSTPLVAGQWLKWCPVRTGCRGYVGPK